MNAALLLVDVFTQRALRGNPVAVVMVPDAADAATGLDDAAMQALAGWIGMPETVFVLPRADDAHDRADDGIDYRVRIWAPRRELPFAGHPAIGTAHALLATGRVAPRDGRLVQASPFGRMTLRVDDGAHGRIWFETPVPRVASIDTNADDAHAVRAALGLHGDDAARAAVFARVEAGARWLVAGLDRADALDRLAPDLPAIEALGVRLDVSGITVMAPCADGRADLELRAFGPAIGVNEDAACGGGNACAAALLAALNGGRAHGADRVAAQGRHLGRDATLYWRGPGPDGRLEVGGHAVLMSEGTLRL